MRALAIIFVVFTHIPSYKKEVTGLDTHEVLAAFFTNGTVLFIFLAGYLFSYLNPTLQFRTYLRKKIAFVILPYLLITSGMLLYRFDVHELPANLLYGNTQTQLEYLIWIYSRGWYVLGPLWFVPMISIFYLCAPLFQWLARSRVGLGLLPITLSLSLWTYRSLYNDNPLLSWIHFFGVYHLGVMVGAYREKVESWLRNPRLLWLFALCSLISYGLLLYDWDWQRLSYFEEYFEGETITLNYSQVQKISFTLLCLGLAGRYIQQRYRLVQSLAECSFGIFFIHAILIYAQGRLGIGHDSHGFLAYLANGSAVLLLTWGIVAGLKKVLGKKSRYLLGC